MKYVELTNQYGKSIFINMVNVIAVEHYPAAPCNSLVICMAPGASYPVKESPDEIFDRLRSLTREC